MSRVQLHDTGRNFAMSQGAYDLYFGEEDFNERIEYAARQLHFIAADTTLQPDELADLRTLVIEEEIADPVSPLAAHVENHFEALFEDPRREPSLQVWLKRLVVRQVVLDHELMNESDDTRLLWQPVDVMFDEGLGDFVYIYPSTIPGPDAEPSVVPYNPAPSWAHVAYRPRS